MPWRGGGTAHFSIDAEEAEAAISECLAESDTPEREFDRRWVLGIMAEAEASLCTEYARKGKEDAFEMLVPFLLEDRGSHGLTFQELAEMRGVSDASLRMAANRMRKRYGEILRERVAATVASPEDIEAEVRHLLEVLRE